MKANRNPIPVTVIGGFLGAGKTTLLNHVLSAHHGVRAGVLVNDFGAVNIDAKLVVGVEGETVSLANGCVCCTIRDDLMGACLELLQRPEPPEHLLIEMSGVANPVPVLETFLQPDLGDLFSLNSSLVVVDAEQLPEFGGELGELARAQIAAADLVVLNKVDLVTRDRLAEVKRRITEIAPRSHFCESAFGRLPSELVFGTGFHTVTAKATRTLQDQSKPPARSHGHTFATWHWTSDHVLSLPKLRSVLDTLPETILRCKGIVCLEELPAYRVVLQMVGRRYHLADSDRWGAEQPRSEIVMIGTKEGIDDQVLQQAFDACVGTGDESQSPILRLARTLGLSE